MPEDFGPKRVMLIADDAIHNRILLKKIFENEYRIEEACDGVEALEKMKALPEVAVLVLDIFMPLLDGFGVLEGMRADARLRDIPTVVATASGDVETQIHALNAGATDVMVKPFNPQIMLHRVRNIIARKEADKLAEYNRAIERELRLTDYDEKSGLYNKQAFLRYTARLLRRNPGKRFVIMRWDIDHFKVYNDFFGVDVGDMFLRKVGAFYRANAKAHPGLMVYARYDADHFVSCWEADAFDADAIADLIHEAIEKRKTVAFEYTIRIGLYLIEDPTVDVSLMCDRALLALRSVKNHYGKRYAWYDDAMREEMIEEQEIVNEMQAALRSGQFCPYLQPQYNHTNGKLIGAEALVRWVHPEKGVISPAKFIPLFEKNGFIFELDQYIWEQACILLRKWMDEGLDPLPLSVNVSRYDVFIDGFYKTVTGLVEKYKIPVDLLRLEITESAFANSGEQIVDVVEKLSEYSFLIEIDDFGSGYSSFNTLKDVPAHILKLDMRFLEDTKNSQRGGSILESIIRMARWLNMPVIAEGVETVEQADFLRSVGCSYVQGYLYGRPMPVPAFEELMRVSEAQHSLTALQTIENLDNNAFWDPHSLETMVFNRYSGGACVFEFYDGHIEMLRVNEKYAVAFNLRMDDEMILKTDLFATLSAEDREAAYSAIDRAASGGGEESFEIKTRGYLPDGDLKYIRFNIRMIARNGDRCLYYAYIENVTIQRLADQRIQSTAQQMQTIMDNVDGGIAALALGDDGQLHKVFSNERLFSMFGYSKEQLDDKLNGTFEVVHPLDRLYVSDLLFTLFKTRESVSFECRAVRGDGGVAFLRCNASVTTLESVPGRPVALLVMTDITAEREADEQFRIVANQSGRNVFRFDVASGESYHSTLGDDGRIFQEVHKDSVESVIESGKIAGGSVDDYRTFFKSICNGVSPLTADFQLVQPDGRNRWYRYTSTTLFNENGRPETAVISSYDCSGEREREQAYAKWRNEVSMMMESGDIIYEWELSRDVCESVSDEDSSPIPRNSGLNAAMLIYAEKNIHEDDRQAFLTMMNRARLIDCYTDGKFQDFMEYRLMQPAGGIRWYKLTVQLVSGHNVGEIRGYFVFQDISEAKRAEIEMRARAEIDALTGALNRGTFIARAGELLELEENAKHAFLMVDLDGFKQVNDTLGHSAGDQALTQLVSTIRSRLRGSDYIGRIGGDEFIIMMRNIPNENIAEVKVRQLCSSLRRKLADGVELSVSIGVSMYPGDGRIFDDLYKNADIALYQAKQSGKNCFCFFNTLVIGDDGKVRYVNTQSGLRVTAASQNSKSILMVGGSGTDYYNVDKWLSRDYNVKQTGDYRQAFSQMRRMRLGLALVLLDMSLPRGGAYEMLRSLANDPLSTIPIIALVEENDDGAATRALEAGAADFIKRPLEQVSFETRVQAVAARSEADQIRMNNYLRIRQQEDEERYIDLLRATGVASINIDWINNVYTYSPQIGEVLGGTYDDRALWQVLLSDRVAKSQDVHALQKMVYDLANDHNRQQAEMNVILRDHANQKKWFRCHVRKLTTENGVADKLLLILQDVDDAMQLHMRLKESERRDPMTGLFSREGFFEEATKKIIGQPPASFCLICVDIDDFKTVNAKNSGALGDEILCVVASALASRVGEKGICCRMFADNFAVLYPYDGHAPEMVEDVRVSAQLRMPEGYQLSLCAGCYLVVDVLAPISIMYEWAMLARTSVKGKDRRRFSYYEEAMHEKLLHLKEE